MDIPEDILDTLKEMEALLSKHGWWQSQTMNKLLDYAENRRSDDFVELLISNSVWGGSGSVVDVVLGNKDDISRFDELVLKLAEWMEATGIRAPRAVNLRKTLELWFELERQGRSEYGGEIEKSE